MYDPPRHLSHARVLIDPCLVFYFDHYIACLDPSFGATAQGPASLRLPCLCLLAAPSFFLIAEQGPWLHTRFCRFRYAPFSSPSLGLLEIHLDGPGLGVESIQNKYRISCSAKAVWLVTPRFVAPSLIVMRLSWLTCSSNHIPTRRSSAASPVHSIAVACTICARREKSQSLVPLHSSCNI